LSDHDYTALAAALKIYFDGFYEGDVAMLKRVFYSGCHLQVATDGHNDDDMEAVYARVAGRPSSASQGEPRRDRIMSLKVVSPSLAVAQVQLSIGAKLFTDVLSFLKLDGQWRIVSKVFSFEAIPR
jgi:hypothetical protein